MPTVKNNYLENLKAGKSVTKRITPHLDEIEHLRQFDKG